MPDTTPTTPAPFRYVDEDDFHLSAHLLADRAPVTLSITIEGSDEPQSAHVPVGDVPRVLAGIATAAGVVLPVTDQPPARLVLGTTDQQPTPPPAGPCDEHGANCRTADWTPRATDQADLRAEVERLRTDRAALQRVRDVLESEHVVGRSAETYRRLLRVALMADGAQQPDTIGLCGACGDPREGHHHGYERTPHAADEAQQPETEAHPAEHTWAAELHDPLADEWVPGTRYHVREWAVNHLEHSREIAPTWKDGTPTQRRLVRATTTYTVVPDEQPDTEAAK